MRVCVCVCVCVCGLFSGSSPVVKNLIAQEVAFVVLRISYLM